LCSWLPAGTPREIVARTNEMFVTALNRPKVREYFANVGSIPFPSTSEELMKFQMTEYDKWRKVIRGAGHTAGIGCWFDAGVVAGGEIRRHHPHEHRQEGYDGFFISTRQQGSFSMQRRQFLSTVAGLGVAALTPLQQALAAAARTPDVVFVPTPDMVIDKMLELANVSANDVVYDLGCGDGRIVVRAAQRFGARAVGVDINPVRITEATANVKAAGVADKVRLIEGDLFEANISEATVVTLYLLPRLNVKLRPKLLKELRPGSRIVSHAFDMGDWVPDEKGSANGIEVYLWRVPART